MTISHVYILHSSCKWGRDRGYPSQCNAYAALSLVLLVFLGIQLFRQRLSQTVNGKSVPWWRINVFWEGDSNYTHVWLFSSVTLKYYDLQSSKLNSLPKIPFDIVAYAFMPFKDNHSRNSCIYQVNTSAMSQFIIHQIFLLTRDWPKRVTWPNIPQLKLWNIREYSPVFKTARVAKKIWRIIKTIVAIWGENMLGYLSLDIICSS